MFGISKESNLLEKQMFWVFIFLLLGFIFSVFFTTVASIPDAGSEHSFFNTNLRQRSDILYNIRMFHVFIVYKYVWNSYIKLSIVMLKHNFVFRLTI